jgi:hypothetical protein
MKSTRQSVSVIRAGALPGLAPGASLVFLLGLFLLPVILLAHFGLLLG